MEGWRVVDEILPKLKNHILLKNVLIYLLSEHAILVKVVLRESMLETAILENSNDFIEFVCSAIELNCFKYGHMKS